MTLYAAPPTPGPVPDARSAGPRTGPTTPKEGRWARFREGRWSPSGWSFAYAVVLTLIVLVVGTAGPWSPVGFAEHRTCLSTVELRNDLLWTPVALENSPYGGWAHSSVVISTSSAGFVTESLDDRAGSASGVFSLDNWSVFRDSNATVLGPGPNLRCGEPYNAVDESRSAGILRGNLTVGVSLLSAGVQSDAQEPTQVNISAPESFFRTAIFPSTVFDDRFESTSVVLSTCGGTPSQETQSTSVTEVRVPFTISGTTALIPAVLPALVTHTYGLGDTVEGAVSIDEGGGFGYSFSWAPCE